MFAPSFMCSARVCASSVAGFLLNTSFATVESSLYGFFSLVRKAKIDGMRSRKRLNKAQTVGD